MNSPFCYWLGTSFCIGSSEEQQFGNKETIAKFPISQSQYFHIDRSTSYVKSIHILKFHLNLHRIYLDKNKEFTKIQFIFGFGEETSKIFVVLMLVGSINYTNNEFCYLFICVTNACQSYLPCAILSCSSPIPLMSFHPQLDPSTFMSS